ncbi:venom allergen 3-like [Schistocerca cancellata]|uniref:venom allergen 3-like n=1 Tax=Schistocerca cancellata TaxID=274614 RepID=UPI002118ED6A|nr:venom allergen 3-like [Schistocerca cancellata]
MVTVVQLLLLLPPLPLLAVDYCALCRAPGSHTLCLYPEAGPSAGCTGYVPAPLTAGEKKALLDTHNGLRSRVALGQGWSPNSTHDAQPKAANMRQMYWDDELASTAQRWADRCDSFYTTRPHDECRDSPRFPVGQNVVTTAYNFPLPKDVRSRVREWYNEIEDFDPSWVSSFSLQPVEDRPTAHYTQLVWGWTYLLGCGRAVFHEVGCPSVCTHCKCNAGTVQLFSSVNEMKTGGQSYQFVTIIEVRQLILSMEDAVVISIIEKRSTVDTDKTW